MRIIICDIYVRLVGHNLGHIQNILRFLETSPSNNEYVFLLNPEAKAIPSIKTSSKNVTITFFTDEEFAPFTTGMSIIKSTQIIWKHITRYTNEYKADKVIMMMLDMFQHTIGSTRFPAQLTGILFSPYPRVIPQDSTLRSKQKYTITKARKLFTTWWMCRNSQLKKVFIFNDLETIKTMNETMGTNIFTYLPDPVYDYPTRQDLIIREKYQIPLHKKILLAFGYIDEKKNVVNLLKALQDLSAEEASNICLLVVGKIRAEHHDALMESLNKAKELRPELQVAMESRFVDDDEMEAYVNQSDIISVAYINFFASSGVIGLAARHNKPVLATKFGVVGDLTREYGLGFTVDGFNPGEIKSAMIDFLKGKNAYPERASVFVSKHSSEKFIKTLLEIE
ncbi:glycosyl transferase group 1 [Emticicia oligotrophica DSM 17448]|uniref:Glycosyl transferase group 1 n=1 Tax=Emticicia oligotrophica (strain DSM 17448 / CIP 109782 / MTCC 6937 / GPTSA100-15) TaxID=929562 RepID=A0ABM5MWV4_EMTOG|nr:glycosyltransferase [Emticicia oligotrophica]AFK01579.1 glycosyl transferase group 1 [Emticicia oligotrophica DSM 17448]